MDAINFGQFLKELRQSMNLSLRGFCQTNSLDPGNISKLERGVMPPPHSKQKLAELADSYGLKKNTAEWDKLFDLAEKTRASGHFHRINDQSVLNRLPQFFRTIDNEKLTEEKLDQIIDFLEEE